MAVTVWKFEGLVFRIIEQKPIGKSRKVSRLDVDSNIPVINSHLQDRSIK